MARMKILNATEQKQFDKAPIFNSRERKKFFDVSSSLMDIAHNLRKPTHQIGFVLTCGYFKASKRFFTPTDYYPRDVEYVARKLDFECEDFHIEEYLRSRIHYHRQMILDFYGFHKFDKNAEQFVKQEVSEMAHSQLKPKLIFWCCVDILIQKRIQVPGYGLLSKIILTGLNQRKKELATFIDQKLTPEARVLMDGLFVQENDGKYARYKLTLKKTFAIYSTCTNQGTSS